MRRTLLALTAASLLAAIAASVASGAASTRGIAVLDDCEPTSFNAAIGPGTCVKDGTVTFGDFIGQLVEMGRAPAWRFAPDHATLDAGGTLVAANHGGEFHTLTEVAAFGGGCVPALNALLGLTPVPECAIAGILFATGIPAGGTLATAPLGAGTHRFMCLIHPWMRTTVEVG
jgi:plastocyanin